MRYIETVQTAARAPIDLRHRAGRACFPLARLPLRADQSTSDGNLRHFRRRPYRALGSRMRSAGRRSGRSSCASHHAHGRARPGCRSQRTAVRQEQCRPRLDHQLASVEGRRREHCRGQCRRGGHHRTQARGGRARRQRKRAARKRGAVSRAGRQHQSVRLDGRPDRLEILVQQALARLYGNHARRDAGLGLAESFTIPSMSTVSSSASDKASTAARPWEDTFPLRGRDGNYRWFLSRARPIRNEAGDVIRWFGTNTDVTEQIEAEKALRELNETLQQRVEAETQERLRIWNVSQDLLVVGDLEGTYLSVNPAWTATLGWSEVRSARQVVGMAAASGRPGKNPRRDRPPGRGRNDGAFREPAASQGWLLSLAVLEGGAGSRPDLRHGARRHGAQAGRE